MSHDLALVIGTIIAVFSIPSAVSAFSEGRIPRVAALVLMLGGGMVAWAVTDHPTGYTMDELPEVFIKVVRDLIG